MYGIEILVDEHKNILKLIDCVKKSCIDILHEKDVDTNLFREYIDFARNYADKHHHGKEELILFQVMVDNMDAVAEKLINHGMLIEHDYGRLYLTNLSEALDAYDVSPSDELKLDIIANAMGYGHHLTRHIDKEDNVIYKFAERELSGAIKDVVNAETEAFEKEHDARADQYVKWLEQVSAKVLGA